MKRFAVVTLFFLVVIGAQQGWMVLAAVNDFAATHQGSDELAGTSWQLIKFEGSDGKTLRPDDKTKYTLAFGTDGRVSAKIDCNRGTGTWKSASSNHLEFGALALTRMMCPPGSLHDQITKQWTHIRSYVIKDGHLFLSLMADGGIYEFEPITGAGPSQDSGGGGGAQDSFQVTPFPKRWSLTEINGAPVKTTKAYLEIDPVTERFSGDGGCNRIAGNLTIDGSNIRLANAISTQRACLAGAQQLIENNFFKALEEATRFSIASDTLRLYAGERLLLTFKADLTSSTTSANTPIAPWQRARITGTINYRQRIALTPESIIEVKLQDVSRADGPAASVAEMRFRAAGKQVPIPFELQYDPSSIIERHRYVIRARILEGRRLTFINSVAYPVITGGNPKKVNVMLNQVTRGRGDAVTR